MLWQSSAQNVPGCSTYPLNSQPNGGPFPLWFHLLPLCSSSLYSTVLTSLLVLELARYVPPWSLCSCCSSCLECLSSEICMAPSLPHCLQVVAQRAPFQWGSPSIHYGKLPSPCCPAFLVSLILLSFLCIPYLALVNMYVILCKKLCFFLCLFQH